MAITPIDDKENERLQLLFKHEILDTAPEREYDDITWLTAKTCDVPIVVVSFFDRDRVWLKSKIGLDVDEIPRANSLCEFALIDRQEVVVVNDASKDPRLADNPFVAEENGIRFYAAVLLVTSDNHVLGSLSIADRVPRELTPVQYQALTAFANQLSQTLDLRLKSLELKRANAELENLSLRDHLTGLYNMRGLEALAEQHLKHLRTRPTDSIVRVVVADMDGLKKINDRFGHHEGSAAIIKTADLLTSCFRASDILARVGGDEFIAFMIGANELPFEQLAARIEEAFDRFNRTRRKPYRLSISIGAASTDHNDSRPLAEIIKSADEAMYRNKQKNRLSSIPGFESTHIHRSVDPFMVSSERLHISGDPKHRS